MDQPFKQPTLTTWKSKWREIGWPALASSIALWAAHAPLGWSWLAWLAPLGWLWVIDRPEAPGKKGYFCLWLAGCVFWLGILQGVRLAYPPLIAGWIALSMYLGVYVPLFVGISRHLIHRVRWPLVAAAPVVWIGLELWRSYLFTGLASSTLAHTQYQHPLLIQLADQLGGYGVGFVMLSVAVGCYRLLQWARQRRQASDQPTNASTARTMFEVIVACVLMAGLVGYGAWRLSEGDQLASADKPLLRVALIQENTPSMFDADPDRLMSAWNRYAELTATALKAAGHVDVVAWPESTFTAMLPWMENHVVDKVPAEMAELQYDRHALKEFVEERQHYFDNKVQTLHGSLQREASVISETHDGTTSSQMPYLLVGNDAIEFHDDRVGRYNAALLINPEGKVTGRYEKMHLVMFGEYIPLGWVLKFVSDTFGLVACTPGTSAKAFEVNNVLIAPSICFESMLPHVISWQMRSLRAAGKNPDVLITITNDSWFRGSSILDHHLACEVMSAVEMRRPFLVAANTGLSAWIAGSGRIVQQSERLQPAFIIAEPRADGRWGLTQLWGDLPAWCLALIVALAMVHGKVSRA